MTDNRQDDPGPSPPAPRPDRRRREAEALRANLARRKVQQRERRGRPSADENGTPTDHAEGESG